MSIELHQTDLQKFNITDTAIAEMREKYLGLKISGLDDKEGLEKVHTARMEVKNKRVNVEKVRKELKEDALKYGRLVDTEAKRITALLAPIESHLEKEEQKIEDEKKKIREEEEKKAKEKIESRIRLLLDCDMKYEITGYKSPTIYISNEQITKLNDDEFLALYNPVKAEYDKITADKIESERIAKEESERLEKQRLEQEKEAERLAKIKAEQEEKELKLKTDQEELTRQKIKDRGYRLFSLGLRWDGEQYKLEDVNVHITEITTKSDSEFDTLIEKITPVIEKKKVDAEKKRKAEIETAKKQAAEKAKKETEARIKKEAEEKRIADEKEKKRLAREAALKPDKEKLSVFIDSLKDGGLPKLKSKEGNELLDEFIKSFNILINDFKKKIKELK